ncbi:LuxR C-terminal-related transcriptional regulator [uncultured Sphingomonas sp.]|uniref:response regulator transcription factor n=1 Tax=Sphingomonas sp. 179-A 2A2 NHS TaxID=3374290 RepID=UPI0025E2C6E0|nr:LuxR C-terminal-related transcriptional regulator [uncultured Sphingomonas sp.]
MSTACDSRTAVRLTPTQIKVLRGVHSGRLNKQIAYDLGIAEATVKSHMTALMRKLNVRNRTQVAIAAQTLALPVA